MVYTHPPPLHPPPPRPRRSVTVETPALSRSDAGRGCYQGVTMVTGERGGGEGGGGLSAGTTGVTGNHGNTVVRGV